MLSINKQFRSTRVSVYARPLRGRHAARLRVTCALPAPVAYADRGRRENHSSKPGDTSAASEAAASVEWCLGLGRGSTGCHERLTAETVTGLSAHCSSRAAFMRRSEHGPLTWYQPQYYSSTNTHSYKPYYNLKLALIFTWLLVSIRYHNIFRNVP